jgi:hypothetical protein
MRKIPLFIIAILFFGLSVYGQTNYEETAEIKEHLNLPLKTIMTFDEAAALSGAEEIRVYIETDGNRKLAKRFSKWVKKWNEKEADDYGKLKIVEDIAEADVILVRYKKREFKPYQRTTVGIGDRVDPVTMGRSSKPTVKNNLYIPYPKYSFLIVRESDEFRIIYRDKDESHIRDNNNPDRDLFDELKEKMKSR